MVVNVNVPNVPAVNVALPALVIAGAWAAATVNVKLWVASGATPLAAASISAYVPAMPAAGMPASVAVPLRLSTKVTPEGSAPLSESAGAGIPVVPTTKVPNVPVANVVPGALVMTGAWLPAM